MSFPKSCIKLDLTAYLGNYLATLSVDQVGVSDKDIIFSKSGFKYLDRSNYLGIMTVESIYYTTFPVKLSLKVPCGKAIMKYMLELWIREYMFL
ncbi:MAG: hypothetical protein U5K51_17150 [Flavobacteriaceae bacterium]|nr:hypothetical protein [Flavobacteriaceae bacterium]